MFIDFKETFKEILKEILLLRFRCIFHVISLLLLESLLGGLELRGELRCASLQELSELSQTALELLRSGQVVECYQSFAEAAGRPQGQAALPHEGRKRKRL